jgi:hypothetical protein
MLQIFGKIKPLPKFEHGKGIIIPFPVQVLALQGSEIALGYALFFDISC